MKTSFIRFLASAMLACAVPLHAAEPVFRLVHKQALPGDVKWDYLAYDSASKRLFITRGDHVDVYDTQHKRVIKRLDGTAGVHGVALAPALKKGFTSNGTSNTVTVFDLTSMKVLATLPTGKNPDAIVYDSFSQRVFAVNAESGDLTVIDANKNVVVGTVTIGGTLEYAAADGKGRLYVNLEEGNKLAAVDTVALKVLDKYDMSASCKEPTGMAVDAAGDRVFVVCRNQNLTVVAGTTGKILASVGIGKGCDAVAYDRKLNRVFTSNGEGTMTIVAADTYTVSQTVTTQRSARTLVLDPANHRLFSVGAEANGPTAPGVKPRWMPGTLSVLTVAR